MSNQLSPWENPAVRRAPNTLTIESIASVSDKDVEEYVADRLWAEWGNYNYNANAFLKTLPSGSRAFFLTWLLEAEVENGGFHQLYWNGYSDLAKIAPSAFEYFGASRHAAVAREAITIKSKEGLLAYLIGLTGNYTWSAKFSKLGPVDDKYYDLPKTLSALRISKIRSSPELFLLRKK